VDLVGSFVGGDGPFDLELIGEDVSTALFDYNGVGILFGGGLNQAVLSNAQYSVTPVPEASTLALLALIGGLSLVRRRLA